MAQNRLSKRIAVVVAGIVAALTGAALAAAAVNSAPESGVLKVRFGGDRRAEGLAQRDCAERGGQSMPGEVAHQEVQAAAWLGAVAISDPRPPAAIRAASEERGRT